MALKNIDMTAGVNNISRPVANGISDHGQSKPKINQSKPNDISWDSLK